MIPTRSKSKIPKSLSWPLGAEAISAGLADTPHVDELSLWFDNAPVWPASAFQRLLRESLPYAILVAEYRPAARLGYSASTLLAEGGWYEGKWQLRVHPVLSGLRAGAGAALCEQGLPAVAAWLRSSDQVGWDMQQHRIELVFAPADRTLTPRLTDRV